MEILIPKGIQNALLVQKLRQFSCSSIENQEFGDDDNDDDDDDDDDDNTDHGTCDKNDVDTNSGADDENTVQVIAAEGEQKASKSLRAASEVWNTLNCIL